MSAPLDLSARGTTIAIIDSGVEGTHPWLANASIRHLQVERRGDAFVVVPAEAGDLSGHGTACAGIIHRMVPAAEIISIRALSPEGRCSRDGLIAALRHAVSAFAARPGEEVVLSIPCTPEALLRAVDTIRNR